MNSTALLKGAGARSCLFSAPQISNAHYNPFVLQMSASLPDSASSAAAKVGPGDVIADKYRVERVLGRGGMGVVVAATHLELGKLRALKFMTPEALRSGSSVERFNREARITAELSSEHVAKVVDTGRLSDGTPYLVMEYLEGKELSSVLKENGPLPVQKAAFYLVQACDGLAEAHARGIIHRDIKPGNLFLTTRADGSSCVKVLDFGISKMAAEIVDGSLTRTDQILGSPFYIAPEQLHSTSEVDARADIWSLGVVLYELLIGKPPFQGDTLPQIVAAVLSGNAKAPSLVNPNLPAAIDAVFARCVEQNREKRFASVAELASELLPFAGEEAAPLVERIHRVLGRKEHWANKSGSLSRPSFSEVSRPSGSPSLPPPPNAAPAPVREPGQSTIQALSAEMDRRALAGRFGDARSRNLVLAITVLALLVMAIVFLSGTSPESQDTTASPSNSGDSVAVLESAPQPTAPLPTASPSLETSAKALKPTAKPNTGSAQGGPGMVKTPAQTARPGADYKPPPDL